MGMEENEVVGLPAMMAASALFQLVPWTVTSAPSGRSLAMTNGLVVWGTITATSIASLGINDATVVMARPALPPLDDISLNLDDDDDVVVWAS